MTASRSRRFPVFAIVLFVLIGCQPPPERPPLPPPQVTVRQPIQRQVGEYRDYTGRIEAREKVAIRARVKGFLTAVHFKEGAEVEEGELLYEIDPREYESALAQARSSEQKEQAVLKRVAEEAERGRTLFAGKAMSAEDYQQRVAAHNAAKAAVEQARAAGANARLQLDFTNIFAPISGRASRTQVTEGNLVGFEEPTLLTTIVAVDPVYVYFDVPERDFLDYQAMIREQGAPTAQEAKVPVLVGLTNEEGFRHQGMIDFRNNQVEPGTGTIQLRGQLPNPERLLTPGLFARVRIPFGADKSRLLVPEVALSSDQRGNFVLVVNAEDKVEARPVKTGPTTDDGMVIVLSGVHAEDWVVVNGLQRARPGAKVQPGKE